MHNDIISFCDKWLFLFDSDKVFDFENDFGDDCEKLSFKMDLFNSFRDAFPDATDATWKTEELERVINNINNPAILGSKLLSQWRSLTHWIMIYNLDDYIDWFKIVLTRLKEIC